MLVPDLHRTTLYHPERSSHRITGERPQSPHLSGRFASHLNRLREGVDRLELLLILFAAPLREVPDVDDREPPPLRPGQVALSE